MLPRHVSVAVLAFSGLLLAASAALPGQAERDAVIKREITTLKEKAATLREQRDIREEELKGDTEFERRAYALFLWPRIGVKGNKYELPGDLAGLRLGWERLYDDMQRFRGDDSITYKMQRLEGALKSFLDQGGSKKEQLDIIKREAFEIHDDLDDHIKALKEEIQQAEVDIAKIDADRKALEEP